MLSDTKDRIISYPAAANGVVTRVIEAGSGDETVLFVHGLGARADRWLKTIGPVASHGYSCIALDLPGHGFAQKGEDITYTAPGYADFISAFLDQNEISKAHLVGTSLGGHVLSTLATRRPQMVRSLMLVGTTGIFPIGQAQRSRIAERIGDRTLAGIRRKLEALLFDTGLADERMVEEEQRINTSPGTDQTFESLANYFRDRIDDDVVGPVLATLKDRFPIGVIWGRHDRSVPLEVGEKTAELLGVQMSILDDAAHAPYWEKPELFNPLLVDFLNAARSTI